MEKILEQENWEWGVDFYPPDVFVDGEYILSKYAIFEKVEEGFLLFHTITRAMYLLTYEEYYNILNNRQLKDDLIIINSNVEEDEISKNVYLKRAQYPLPSYNDIKSYVIFTTNNCNAQCFYCYENTDNKPSFIERGMTIKTAEKVVQYILKTKSHNEPIKITWFGGEPLLNIKVIDYITQRLKDENVVYTSHIITNGLLFNNTIIKKATEEWNTKYIQITIDGIGDTYNQIKNYKAIKFDAFNKIINNIRKILLNDNIKLSIRANIYNNNINDVEDVLKYFTENFKKNIENSTLMLSVKPIYQLDADDDEIDNPIFDKIDELRQKYIFNTLRRNTLKHTSLTHCMGDTGRGVAISPKGNLNVCEHWADENIIGNVVDGVTNPDIIKEWNNKEGENIEFCLSEKCPYLPICNHLTHCPSDPSCKSIERMTKMGREYRKLMLDEYKKYKKKKEDNKNENGEE